MSARRRVGVCAAAVLLLPSSLLAWGPNGHRIVGQIGQAHLGPEAVAAVEAILGAASLAQVATWPDDIRSDPDWNHASPWHFISIDDDETFEGLRRDDRGDILSKLADAEAVLRSADAGDEERWQAVAWMVHLMGDLHQPLHVGRRDDRGGNRVHVHWFEEESNLHKVWDEEMLEHQDLSFTEYAAFLDQASTEELAAWQQGVFLDWAQESFDVRSEVYDYDTIDLSYRYSYLKRPLMDRRLLQAGVRLAGVLNSIYSGGGGSADGD